jgi:ribokinase
MCPLLALRGRVGGYPRTVPKLPAPRRAAPRRPSVVVLGDLLLDVVLIPSRPLERATDVPGSVQLRQGGSAASTAVWLGRLGVQTTFVCAVGRDAIGRALVDRVRSDQVKVAAVRVAGARTGRIGVVLEPGGERSFVADRGAADRIAPGDLRAAWFKGADLLHLPAYSLLTQPLGEAGLAAARMARDGRALVSVDLASIGPLLEIGRRTVLGLLRDVAPDLVLATGAEAEGLLGTKYERGLLDLAPIAVVKRGAKGATVLARDGDDVLRFEVATRPLPSSDTTGAGDAFDAGFITGWLEGRQRRSPLAGALQRAAMAANRAASRHLSTPPSELMLG